MHWARASRLFKMLPGLMVLVGSVSGQTQAATPELKGMVQREVAMLQLCGGYTPLSAREQHQVAQAVQTAMKADAQAWLNDDQYAKQVLGRLAQRDAVYISAVREGCRLNAEIGRSSSPKLQPLFDTERVIIRAHDPTVVLEAGNKRLVTERGLVVLRDYSAQFAQQVGYPAPGDTFIPQLQQLRAGFLTLKPDDADAFAHIERNAVYLQAGLQILSAQQRNDILTKELKLLKSLSPAKATWQLAYDSAVLSKNGQAYVPQLRQMQALNQMLWNQTVTHVMHGMDPGCMGIGDDAHQNSDAYCSGNPLAPNVSGGSQANH